MGFPLRAVCGFDVALTGVAPNVKLTISSFPLQDSFPTALTVIKFPHISTLVSHMVTLNNNKNNTYKATSLISPFEVVSFDMHLEMMFCSVDKVPS